MKIIFIQTPEILILTIRYDLDDIEDVLEVDIHFDNTIDILLNYVIEVLGEKFEGLTFETSRIMKGSSLLANDKYLQQANIN
jgi:hypothetical protein